MSLCNTKSIRMSASVRERETETRRARVLRQTGQHDRQLPVVWPPSSQTLARPWAPQIKVDPTNAEVIPSDFGST